MTTTNGSAKNKAEELGTMQNTVLELLSKIIQDYKVYPETHSIKMSLSSAFKELNSIRLKVVVGDDPNADKKESNAGV